MASLGVTNMTSEVARFMKYAPKPPHLIPGEREIKWMVMMGKMKAHLFQ